MTTIYRLKKDLVSVDGITCKLNEYDGRYYPIMECLYNVSLFPDAIDGFLEAEEVMHKEDFHDELDEMLFYTGIDYADID